MPAAGTATAVTWRRNDYVTIPGRAGFEGVWQVWKISAKVLTLRNVATGKGAHVPAPGSGLKEATYAEIGEALATAPKVDELGLVIKFVKGTGTPDGLFAVIKLNPNGTFNATKLGGGDNGRYYTNILPAAVQVIPVAEITAALASGS